MLRKAFLMKIKPGMIAEYEKRHNPIWPELHRILKTRGISNYSIFHHEKTNQLFGYVEIESEAKLADLEENEVCGKWWLEMKKYLVSESEDSPRAIEDPMGEVFHIE